MADNTVFDSVFKTMLKKIPQLIIPFINEAFGRSYPSDAEVVQFSNEHVALRGSIIDDSVFRVGSKIYHIECQSTPDANMVIRMIEYDFSIALEQALHDGAPYRLEFPTSCVLFLRHTASTPDVLSMEVVLPDGASFIYHVKVVKAQCYSKNELFEKQLLLLFPYYLMRYEKELGQIAQNDEKTRELLAECSDLRRRLESFRFKAGGSAPYAELIELIIRVSDHLLAAHESLREGVRAAMGGEVLELTEERAHREGYAEGHAEGHAEGVAICLDEFSEHLAELGFSPEAVKKAADATLASIEEGRKRGPNSPNADSN